MNTRNFSYIRVQNGTSSLLKKGEAKEVFQEKD